MLVSGITSLVARPYGPTGANSGARLYVDGVAVAAAAGGYTGTDENVLTIGASTGDDTNTTPGAANHFVGVLDELEMFVMGTSTATQTDFGTFNLGTDNPIVAASMAGIPDGDLTGDGNVTGDGTGDPSTDDVSAFVDGWRYEKTLNGVRIGDLETRNMGDFNYDGVVNLLDWQVLRINHATGAAGVDLGELLAAVPEPSALLLAGLAAVFCSLTRKFHPLPGGRTALGKCRHFLI